MRRILEWTARDLATRGVDTPRLDAELLLAHALGTDRLGLFLDLDRPLGEAERAQFRELVARRRRREPVAYVIGTKEFWSLSFAVGPATLVPRPDTEAVVEEALEAIPGDGRGLRAVDVGCGSGCIGLSLAHERSGLRVVSVDVDRRTAAVAAANAAALGLADRVDVVVGDLVSCLAGHVDLLVANLPYVPSGEIESLEPEVSRWEPRRALDGGADGLDLFRRLLADCPRLLAPGAAILLEVGHDGQARQVVGLLGDGWSDVEVRRDYSGVQRVVSARRQPAAFTAPRQ